MENPIDKVWMKHPQKEFMSTAVYTKFSSGEVNKLMKLVIPLVLTGFIESSVGFFTTLFLAHLGPQELAAGAVVQWIFFTLMVVLWGTLCSVSILVAQKYGSKDEKGIAQVLFDGLILSLYFVIPAFLLLRNIGPILLFAGQDPETVKLAQDYMQGLSWGLVPDFVGLVLMQFLIGLGHTRTNMVFTLFWVPLNILSNYALIFGKFGFPALGMAGIGWGTTLAYWILAVVLVLYLVTAKRYRNYFDMIIKLRTSKFIGELCQIGIPMGSMYCIEIAFFLTITLMMGRINSEELAGNQIALQFLGQLSVVTFSVAQAVTVRMGHTLGAHELSMAERAVYIGTVLAVSFMIMVAIAYWFFPETLIAIDLDLSLKKNAAIIFYTKQFLSVCAIFESLEAMRFVLFGALRGLKDTRFTLLASIISFWGISLPIGYCFSTELHMGGYGLWWGIVVGAVFGAVILLLRFRFKMKQQYSIHQRMLLEKAKRSPSPIL
jgi:MATE family multidrug resistance protein